MTKLIAVLLLVLVSPFASASLVTIDDTFVVTNIANAPNLTITGAFKFTYDDAVASSGNIVGATISVPVSGSIAYAYDPAGPFFLTIYDTLNAQNVYGGTQDFSIWLSTIYDAGPRFFYATPSSRIVSGGMITVDPVTATAIPEPESLGLSGLGLAALGFMRRKRSGALTA